MTVQVLSRTVILLFCLKILLFGRIFLFILQLNFFKMKKFIGLISSILFLLKIKKCQWCETLFFTGAVKFNKDYVYCSKKCCHTHIDFLDD